METNLGSIGLEEILLLTVVDSVSQSASREKDQQRQVEVALEETKEKYKQLQDENKKLIMVRLATMMGSFVDFPRSNLSYKAHLTAFLPFRTSIRTSKVK